jgi:crotonobetainyl-CoA:carnitine CoA-transferase CaiB-like acyl-CoA transferase
MLQGMKTHGLCRSLQGSAAVRYLADMGAGVIKHQRSLAADRKSDSGRGIFLSSVETADIVVEGVRPGAMESL